ncbi:MAG: cytochrome-c peroxidase [Methyloligellaceae bacterium]
MALSEVSQPQAAEDALGAGVTPRASEPILPLPTVVLLDLNKVRLGRQLFYDKRLSRNDSMSCASCHDMKKGGADGKKFARGWNGTLIEINTPTVLNSGLNPTKFWDGRAKTLEAQVDGPLQSEAEMGSTWEQVIGKLSKDDDLAKAFRAVYHDGLTSMNIKDAIATYERSLITPNAPFDRYLRGDYSAITAEEKAGYQLFKSLGCTACHQGRNVGGNVFQKFGVIDDYFRERVILGKDLGRYSVTGRYEDRHVFRVPSLRNVELTAPYFHDGSVGTLEEAVQIMAWYQLGQAIEGDEVEKIVAFLKTLTGNMPEGS